MTVIRRSRNSNDEKQENSLKKTYNVISTKMTELEKKSLEISKFHSKKEERSFRTIVRIPDDKMSLKGEMKETEKEIRAYENNNNNLMKQINHLKSLKNAAHKAN